MPVKIIIQITGGIPGLYLLLILPPFLAFQARKWLKNTPTLYEDMNIHRPTLKSYFWIYLSWGIGLFLIIFQLINTII